MTDAGVSSSIRVVLFTDVVGSTELKSRLGSHGYLPLLQRHNDLFIHACGRFRGRVVKHTGDGFLALFDAASDAVRAALVFQHAMRAEPWHPERLETRVGIHSGEVADVKVAGQEDVSGLAADLAARVMSLAQGGQVLLTRWPFNDARQFVPGHPADGDHHHAPPPLLRWVAHGAYLFKGSEEPMEVFEVGAEGLAPLAAPPGGEKARRVVPHDQEVTLGWRPAVGLEIDGRPGWLLERKLGEGGFGEVWLARHGRTKERRVFKFCFDAERLRSFKRELTLFRLLREALGERKDIARLHEVKLDKQPFYLESEYAEGGNLLDWAAAQGGIDKLPLGRRLEIVASVADALAAAHSVGVLHKDVKPSNVLMETTADGAMTPMLADFGIGILTDRSQLANRHITETGFTILTQNDSSRTGTRMYSPPELLAGKPFTVQGDIYALGVLLYQMVVADLERPLAEGWEREVPDELLREDVAACVDGDPFKRLGSATDLAKRLCGIGHRRAQRQAARAAREAANRRRRVLRGAVALSVLLAVLLAAGITAAMLHLRRLNTEKKATEKALAMARRLLSDAYAAEGMRLVEAGDPCLALLWFVRSIEAAPGDAASEHYGRLRFATTLQIAPRLQDIPIDWNVSVGPSDFENVRTGRRIDIKEKTAWVVDVATGRPVTPPMMHDDRVVSAAFSPDGTKLLTTSGDRTVRVWQAATGQPLTAPMRHEDVVQFATFSPDGTRLATVSYSSATDDSKHTHRVWGATAGPILIPMMTHEGGVWSVNYSRDGTRLATASLDGTARVWDTATGQPLTAAMKHEGSVVSANFSPDSTKLATASNDKTARIWDTTTGMPLTPPMKHEHDVRSAIFSPDGTKLATASRDGTARIWDAMTGQPIIPPMKHKMDVESVTFSPDGTKLATASSDGTARVWDAASGRPLTQPIVQHLWVWVRSVAFSPDGTRLATASDDKTARVWDAATGRPLSPPMMHDAGVISAVFSPDGTKVATASFDYTARIWSAEGQPVTPPLKHKDTVMSATFSPDGTKLTTASMDGTARVWDTATGQPVTPPLNHNDGVSSATFSPDGTWLATSSFDKTARLWDLKADARPLDDLRALAELLAARRLDEQVGLHSLTGEEWTTRWNAMRLKYPEQFRSGPAAATAPSTRPAPQPAGAPAPDK